MARNVFEVFQDMAAARPDAAAARVSAGGAWRDVTWREIARTADAAGAGVVALGVQPGERVAILSNTRLEWSIADLAIMAAGAVSVPIYQSSTAAECEYILNDAGCVAAFVEDAQQVAKLAAVRARTPALRAVVCFEPCATPGDGWVAPWTRFVDEARARIGDGGCAAVPVGADALLTIVYTSGTTGPPKGAMLTHDSLLYAAGAARDLGIVSPDDVGYLFLPLAHVFARLLEVSWFATGHVQTFWQRDPKKVVDELAQVRPTFFAAVPRVFEKVHARVVEEVERLAGVRGRLARWALAQAHRATDSPVDPALLVARRSSSGRSAAGCRRGSADGSASRCPAARRCRATSRTSSTTSASASARATA